MDLTMVAMLLVVCFLFYRIIHCAVKVLRIVFVSDYPANAEELPILPFIGHAYLFIGDTEAILNTVMKLGNKYPTSFRLFFGNSSVVFSTFPRHLKEILFSPKTTEKNFFYDFARPAVGDGLLTGSGSKWEEHRKLLQPSFTSMAVKSFLGTFATQSNILAKKMERHLNGPEFIIFEYLSLCTINTICAATMGINLEAQETRKCEYNEAAEKIAAGIAKRAVSPWLYPDSIFYRTQLGKDEEKYSKVLYELVDNVIREKKEEIILRSNQRVSADAKQDASAVPRVLIENLFRLSSDNKMLKDKEVRDHVNTIIATGNDTTAVAMKYLMLMLASNQDIQEKIHQELCDIFGENLLHDESTELHITMEVLARMTYMERVIKETMRLFPVVPAIFRKATDDLHLGQCTLPKGSSVVINIIGVHRSEKYWPDPLKFDPDRFLPERFAKQEPFSYLPFSGGRRNCIGGKYAMLFMKTMIATILRKFVLFKDKVEPVEDMRLKIDFILTSVHPETLRIKRRAKRHGS